MQALWVSPFSWYGPRQPISGSNLFEPALLLLKKSEQGFLGASPIEHFPLDIAAFNASKIAQCKNDQSLEILESLYSNQQAWVKGNTVKEINNSLKKFIEDEGFKVDFEKCVNDKEIEDFVLNDRIEGAKNFKVNATPTIIINNKKFEKSLNYKNLKKSLEKLI